MAENHDTGNQGEDAAEQYLIGQGFRILKRNWRHLHLEIDLLAMDGEMLVVVEVKTRGRIDFGDPQSFVTKTKQKKLIRAANYYITENDFNGETRFDVIAVLKRNEVLEINHIPDAFRPTEQ